MEWKAEKGVWNIAYLFLQLCEKWDHAERCALLFLLIFFVFLLRLLHLQLPVACFCCCCCSFSCCCVFISLSFRRNGSDVWQMYTRTAGRNTNHCCCLQNSEKPINSFQCWRTIFCFFWKLFEIDHFILFDTFQKYFGCLSWRCRQEANQPSVWNVN